MKMQAIIILILSLPKSGGENKVLKEHRAVQSIRPHPNRTRQVGFCPRLILDDKAFRIWIN